MRIDDVLKNIPPNITNQVEELLKQYIQEKEQQLSSSERKFQHMISNLLDVVAEIDLEGVFTFVSPQSVDLLGYQPEEVIGRNGFEFVHPEDQASAIESLRKAISGSHVFDYEYRAKHKDGYYIWLSASGRCIEKDQGRRLILIIKDISERKRVEETLREGKQQYLSILESMGDAIHVINRDLRFNFTNSTFKKWNEELGLLTDVIGHKIEEIFPFLTKRVIDEYRQVLSSGKPLITEESTWINGREFFTETRKIPLFDGNQVIQVVTIIRDITKRKLGEEELKRTKNEREQILNSLVEHVVYQDTQHRILWANQAACDSVKKTLDQLVGEYCYQVWNRRSAPCIDCPVDKAFQIKKSQENEMITPDGRVWSIQGVPVFDSNGEITGAVETTLEITERKNAEESLRESKEKYQMLVEKLREGVLLEDINGFITFVNPHITKMIGYSKEELLGKHYTFIVPEKELHKIKAEASKRPKGISSTYEASLLAKDKHQIPVIITTTSLFSKDKKFDGVLSVFTDITERKQAEEERNRLIEKRKEFMDQAAHELRTPLTIIKGYTEFLKMRETDVENQRILNIIMNNVIRLEELGTSVSDIYRIERGKFEVILEKIEFHDFLKDFLDPYIELYEGQFCFTDHELKDQLMVNADPKRLKSVLSNVLDNAIRNTAPSTRKIRLDLIVTKDEVRVVIIDNGAGIKQEHLEKVFDKFTSFPTKYDITGTGIGLYIAREIINAHNGSISAYSEGEDKGTTITIKLPRLPEYFRET